jgi:hypothetical protein
MRTGLEPVGRPRTKGCVGVGAKALILSLDELEMVGGSEGLEYY